MESRNRREKRERRVKLRRENQFHRGGRTSTRTKPMEKYVYGRRNGQVRRDRNQTVEQVERVLKRRKDRKDDHRKIRIVGTSSELGRLRERGEETVGKREGRERVTRGWVSGRLTNRWRQREGSQETRKRIEDLPGLVRFRHPKDHGVGRNEARRCGIPTGGIADGDCECVDKLTYPIPGNDESRGGQRRRRKRIQNRWKE